MVNDNAFRGGGDLSVHKYFCSSAKPVLGAFCVIVVAVKFDIPFMTADFFKILRVDYGVFALCQADFSEDAAIAQTSVQQDEPNAENFRDGRNLDFDCNFDFADYF